MQLTGKEYIEKAGRGGEYIRYTYHYAGGIKYHCIQPSLEGCRRLRDRWIKENYLLFNNQAVFRRHSHERLVVLNTNIKGYTVLIHERTAGIEVVPRDAFFRIYTLFHQNELAGIRPEDAVYDLMVRSYRLNFNKKDKQTTG